MRRTKRKRERERERERTMDRREREKKKKRYLSHFIILNIRNTSPSERAQMKKMKNKVK